MSIAQTPTPPYYAVIYTSIRRTHQADNGIDEDDNNNDNDDDSDGYNEMANRMIELACQQKGFLGFESARNTIGISVSYWESLHDIKNWKQNSEHLVAQQKGRTNWYSSYTTRICKVERDYTFSI